jgi:cyclopropane fatty-acyl-phospholipid synthase-like methyltransferase
MKSARSLPGEHLDATKVPGHWLLSRLGKRVLRPGGLELTRCMLEGLSIRPDDDVVEFGPGLGVTRLTLARRPHSYVGIERNENAATIVRRYLRGLGRNCLIASAEKTGMASAQASVVYGEAMLTMQSDRQKAMIIAEASRLLRPGGRYGIHELCLVPDDIRRETRELIENDLTSTIHVGARPLTIAEWHTLLAEHNFRITHSATAPMHLFEVPRLIQDEGLGRVLVIAGRLLVDGEARARVFAMKNAFRNHGTHLRAVTIIGQKP